MAYLGVDGQTLVPVSRLTVLPTAVRLASASVVPVLVRRAPAAIVVVTVLARCALRSTIRLTQMSEHLQRCRWEGTYLVIAAPSPLAKRVVASVATGLGPVGQPTVVGRGIRRSRCGPPPRGFPLLPRVPVPVLLISTVTVAVPVTVTLAFSFPVTLPSISLSLPLPVALLLALALSFAWVLTLSPIPVAMPVAPPVSVALRVPLALLACTTLVTALPTRHVARFLTSIALGPLVIGFVASTRTTVTAGPRLLAGVPRSWPARGRR